jgi:hypothetical protein
MVFNLLLKSERRPLSVLLLLLFKVLDHGAQGVEKIAGQRIPA